MTKKFHWLLWPTLSFWVMARIFLMIYSTEENGPLYQFPDHSDIPNLTYFHSQFIGFIFNFSIDLCLILIKPIKHLIQPEPQHQLQPPSNRAISLLNSIYGHLFRKHWSYLIHYNGHWRRQVNYKWRLIHHQQTDHLKLNLLRVRSSSAHAQQSLAIQLPTDSWTTRIVSLNKLTPLEIHCLTDFAVIQW